MKPTFPNTKAADEWRTPPFIIEAAREVMGSIDLDPASSFQANEIVQATQFFTIEADGLKQRWGAKNIWLNPPYSHPAIGNFVDKLVAEYVSGNFDQATVLINAKTETKYFRALGSVCDAMCLPSKRISFYDAEGQPMHGNNNSQAIFFLGENRRYIADFRRRFEAIGQVYKRME